MNLPYDRLIAQPFQVNPSQIPPFQVNLPPPLAALAPEAAAILVNTAIENRDGHAGRMLCANLFLQNNLANSEISGWTEMVIRYAVMRAMKQNNAYNVNGYLKEAATNIAGFVTGILIVKNPFLANVIPATVVQNAQRNSSEFTNQLLPVLKNLDLSAFSSGTVTNTAADLVNSYQPSSQQTSQNGLSSWGTTGTTSNNNSLKQTNMPSVVGGWGTSGTTSSSTTMTAAEASHQPPQQNNWGLIASPSTESFSLSTDKKETQPAATQNTVSDAVCVLETTTPSPTVKPRLLGLDGQPVVTCFGMNEMDINTHAIPYFGAPELYLNMSSRTQDLKLDSLMVGREGRNEVVPAESVLLCGEVTSYTSFEEALFATRFAMENAYLISGKRTQMYRRFTNILCPINCTEDGQLVSGMFGARHTYRDLPGVFRKFVASLKDPSNPTENEALVLNTYAFFDARLARAVNNFTKYHLRSKITMESFSADADEFIQTLANNRGSGYAASLEAWFLNLTDMLSTSFTEASHTFLSSAFESPNQVGTPKFTFFPERHSFTQLNLTYQELGYQASEDGMLIDPKSTSVLNDIVQSLDQNKRNMKLFTTHDWIITADDVRFRVAECAQRPGLFYMFQQPMAS